RAGRATGATGGRSGADPGARPLGSPAAPAVGGDLGRRAGRDRRRGGPIRRRTRLHPAAGQRRPRCGTAEPRRAARTALTPGLMRGAGPTTWGPTPWVGKWHAG